MVSMAGGHSPYKAASPRGAGGLSLQSVLVPPQPGGAGVPCLATTVVVGAGELAEPC